MEKGDSPGIHQLGSFPTLNWAEKLWVRAARMGKRLSNRAALLFEAKKLRRSWRKRIFCHLLAVLSGTLPDCQGCHLYRCEKDPRWIKHVLQLTRCLLPRMTLSSATFLCYGQWVFGGILRSRHQVQPMIQRLEMQIEPRPFPRAHTKVAGNGWTLWQGKGPKD